MSDETYTTEQAREALELLYDCARMEIGNDAIGPRNVLESFIKQAARRMRERQTIPRYRAIGYDPDTRCAEMIADSEGAWVHVLDMEETTHEREPSIDASTHEPWDKQRDRQLSDAMSTEGLAGRSVDRSKRDPGKVTDDKVNQACLVYNDSIEKSHDGFDLPWCDEDAMRAALEAFAASLSTGKAVANGRILVPIEPTDVMVDAGTSKHNCEQGDPWYGASKLSDSDCIAIYKAMLATAPEVTK